MWKKIALLDLKMYLNYEYYFVGKRRWYSSFLMFIMLPLGNLKKIASTDYYDVKSYKFIVSEVWNSLSSH